MPAVDEAPEELLEIPLVVDPGRDGFRLDRFIASRIARLSRTRVQGIVDSGRVRRAETGEVLLRASQRVRAGETLIILRPAPVEPPVVFDYRELFRDDCLMAVDKPAGLPVHPSARYHRHTLTQVLRARLGAGHGWEMAHRLDRETSGVMVFGRRGGSAALVKKSFIAREVEKVYWALVRGCLSEPVRIDMPLGPAIGSQIRVKMGPVPQADGGLPAATRVRPLARGNFKGEAITLVEALPETGRQHQIRVHLAEIGHPLIGDKLYGIAEEKFLKIVEGGRPLQELEAELGLSRHALHAAALTLPHPGSGERVTFRAPWPEELAAILSAGAAEPRPA
jgi:23S rRNA pseudouridine1911/1915/1917 synthase